MALYVKQNGEVLQQVWHTGYPAPNIHQRVVIFQADGDELDLIVRAISATRLGPSIPTPKLPKTELDTIIQCAKIVLCLACGYSIGYTGSHGGLGSHIPSLGLYKMDWRECYSCASVREAIASYENKEVSP